MLYLNHFDVENENYVCDGGGVVFFFNIRTTDDNSNNI